MPHMKVSSEVAFESHFLKKNFRCVTGFTLFRSHLVNWTGYSKEQSITGTGLAKYCSGHRSSVVGCNNL